MEGQPEKPSESLVIRSLRLLMDKYFYTTGKLDRVSYPFPNSVGEDVSLLEGLPVGVQFLILTLLTPEDICHLGATSRYWRTMVRDPLLWKYFLLRDTPHWPSIDHATMPQKRALASLYSDNLPLKERVEGDISNYDYMAEYLKGHPACRQRWVLRRPPYEVVTSFLQSLLPLSEPRYAMFGPGIEQLDVSMVTMLMHAPDVLPVTAIPSGRQINGIGSGISYTFQNQHRFNILTLYSTNKAERDRARVGQHIVHDKLFTLEGTDQSGCPIFSPTPQVQEVCQAVNGFIYVANAELGTGVGDVEAAKIQSVMSAAWGSTSRPLLVLSCVSREQPEAAVVACGTKCRTPSVEVAWRLRLPDLQNPWKVQDTVAESLSGLLDGISWLLRYSGLRV